MHRKPDDNAIGRLVSELITTRFVEVKPSSYDKEKKSVRVVAASEKPVQIFDWERWEIVDEVLLMAGFELPETRQVPLLDTHSRWSVDDVLGSARNFTSNGSVLEADTFFSSVEEDVETKVREGHLTDLSVGYRALESTYIPKNEKAVIRGRTFEGPLKVTSRWLVKELSLAPIGADETAKVRSLPEYQEIIKRMNNNTSNPGGSVMETTNPAPGVTPAPLPPAFDYKRVETLESQLTEVTRQLADKSESERKEQIHAISTRFVGRVPKVDELREKAITDKWSPDRFKGEIIDRISDDGPIDTPDTTLGLTRKQVQQFSFTRAIMNKIDPRNKAEFELECMRALREKGIGTRADSILVPYDVLAGGRQAMDNFQNHPDFTQFFKTSKRNLVTTSAASAGNLIATNLLASSFIELLRNKMLLTSLGVRMLTGLVGNIAIPRQTGTGTAVWETEATGITSESTQTFDQLTLSPNEVGAYTEVSRKMLQQGTPAVEGLVQSDLSTILALAIDLAGFHGSGGTQPTGIVGTSGVGSVNGAALDWPAIVEFETDVATANAEVASMAYVTTAAIHGLLKTRVKESGFPVYLMNDNGQMNGYRCERTNQITAGYMFFGDFSQALIAEWGVLEMLVNPYILDKEGLVRITVHQSVDFGVRQAGAFSVSSTVS